MALKRWIGRLKPHVNWWDKDAAFPALSCPSSHAFNTAFLLVLIWSILKYEERMRWRNYFFGLGAITLFIGVSRIVFTQHYPLDVLLGWILGAMLAVIFKPFVLKYLSNKRF